jgi:purine nucleosidase
LKPDISTRVLIDTDCGVDDAVALLIALASPEIEILGVTTVSGNVGVGQVTDNVLRLLAHFERREIPVYRGASRALVEPPRRAAGIHGENGLGGVFLPEADQKAEAASAPEAMVRTARAYPGLTLVTLGPLTNAAIALNLYPEIKELLGEVVVMGGALERGNVTPYAEFNFFADPEAVQIVLESGVPMTIVTWDAALRAMFTEKELRGLGFEHSPAGRLMLEMEACSLDYLERIHGRRMVALPDPLTVAWLVEPAAAVSMMETGMRVELAPGPRRGASSVVERASAPGEHAGALERRVRVVTEIDKDKFTDILLRIQEL